jgi:CRISPR/Cas system CSM-associated protein Csm3 (group 7 of RAMP superfamily)
MAEKNYGFIHSKRPNREKFTFRTPIEDVYKIEYLLITKSPLHVGNGAPYKKSDQVGKGIMRNSIGFPIIPGSTLKGVCRSNFNLIVKNTCIYQCKFNNRSRKICKTCDLFGTMSLGSRIRFHDAIAQLEPTNTPIEEIINIPHLMEPHRERKFHQKYYKNINFDPNNTGEVPIWIIPPNTEFKGSFIIENCDDFELMAVLLALNLRPEILIGGGKNLGLGHCLINLDQSQVSIYNGKGEVEESEIIASKYIHNWENDYRINTHAIQEIRNSRGEPYHT